MYYKYTGTNSLDGAGQDMATTVMTVNTGEDVHDYYRIKTPVGKKLGLSNFAPSSRACNGEKIWGQATMPVLYRRDLIAR